MSTHNYFSGIWHSHYKYTSSSRQGEFEGEHYVRAYQRGHKLVFESVKESAKNRSYLVIRLSVDDREDVATGTWQESTDKSGHYKGALYHGAIQLVISDDKHKLQGKWVGFGKDGEVNTGPWELKYIGKALPDSAE